MKILLVAFLFSLSLSAVAQQNEQRRPHREPPQEAIDACDGFSENESVQFTTPRGDSLEATCQIVNNQLVAVPTNHQRRNKGERRSDN